MKGEVRMIFKGRNRVTSGFRLPDRRDHNGIDIVGDDDRTVRATVSGKVGTATKVPRGPDRTWEWGNYVRIDADDGTQHFYCHMADGSLRVRRGQRVAVGTPLGIMGNTGYSFGPHVHYEVRENGKAINPAAYAGVENKKGTYVEQEEEEMRIIMSDKPIRMCIGPMSHGDFVGVYAMMKEKSIKCVEIENAIAEGRKIPEEGTLTTIPAVSVGDQIGLLALAYEKQVGWAPVCESSTDAQLQDKLRAAEKARDAALAERDRANHNAGEYLKKIEAVKAAVGV